MGWKFSEFSEFGQSDESPKHELDTIKDPASHMCLAGTVVVSWSLMQDVTSLITFTLMTNILVTGFNLLL